MKIAQPLALLVTFWILAIPVTSAAVPPPDGVEGPHGSIPGFPVNSCYVCHDIVPGGTGPDAVMLPNETCFGCHTDGDTYGTGDPLIEDRPRATAVGNHASLVTGSTRFTYGDYDAVWPWPELEQEVHCTTCHDPHRTFDPNDSNPSTQNIMYIRDRTDDWQVNPSFQLILAPYKELKVIDHTGGSPVEVIKQVDQAIVYTQRGDFADGLGEMAAETDVCEVCHTLTNHHQVDNSAPGGQSHYDGEDCTACHSHSGGFGPSGWQPLTGPHAVFGDPSCGACHDQPTFPGNPDNLEGLASVFCAGCHDPATIADVHSHTVTGTTRFEYTMECLSCHDQHGWDITNIDGSDNIRYVKAHVFEEIDVIDNTSGGVPVSKIIDSDIVFTGLGDFANGDALYSRDICVTCHTLTSHHQNDGDAPGGQSHYDGEDCTACHTHPGGFGPSGWEPLTGPHATFGDPNCGACHDQPSFPGNPDNLEGLASVFCAGCHDPATVADVHSHTVTGTTRFEYTMECLSCHDQHGWEIANVNGTDNIKYVKAHVFEEIDVIDNTSGGVPVSKIIDSDIVFTGLGDFANGDALYSRDICVTCHTLTSHHQNDGDAPGGQSHYDGEDCTACHTHPGGFGGFEGGPHPQAITDCSNCHLGDEGEQDLVGIHGGLCSICHVDGYASTFLGPLGTWGDECGDCHNPQIDQTGNADIHSKGHRCVACHGEQRDTGGMQWIHWRHTEAANCVVCHGFIPDLGTEVGSGNRDLCFVCHTSANGSIEEIHEPHTAEGLSCLECHGDERPPIDVVFGPPVGDAEIVCEICHNYANDSPRDIHEKHTDMRLDCGSCHLDAILQDDRVPMPSIDDARRAMTDRSSWQECFICHDNENGSTTYVHRKHVGDQWQWCYNCHLPSDDRPQGGSGPAMDPVSSCAVCHNGHTYNDDEPFDIHDRHADAVKCYSCHQTDPRLFNWPISWLGGTAVSVPDLEIEDEPETPPATGLALVSHPNPFNPSTTITFTLPQAGPVTLFVYDVKGQLVELLLHNEQRSAGEHSLTFHPQAASGVYFIHMVSGSQAVTNKAILMK